MGKSKKIKGNKAGPNGPLERQIENAKFIKPKNRNKIRFRQAEDEEFVDANLSKKIISAARQQQMELGEDFGPTPAEADRQTVKLGNMDSDESEMEDNLEPDHFYEKIEINEEDEKALELFMNKDPAPRRTLADIIMDKITEKQTEIQSQFSESGLEPTSKLDPRVVQIYEGVRDVLKNYRSGKLPKAFKIIPKLSNWEEILNITDPMGWSAAGMYQGTRIFASNLKENMAQRYYNLVLLPRIRDDIAEYKRLNFHLYQALRKALFKPGAFMKGIILPLLESGTCTLREAIIVGSVVQRNSLPMIHSAAVLLKIAEMDYTGANSVFLRILFDKKYALPYRVVDAAVFHFLRFKTDTRELPVLWHQAFLTFVQRYKGDISSEQRDALLELLRYQTHASITPEIRRELQNAKCRDTEIGEPMKTDTD